MCTSITFKTNDNSVIHGRTDEFGIFYNNNITLFPRNYEFGNGYTGLGTFNIKSKYAMIATNIGTVFEDKFSMIDIINDGMNEAGLSMSALFYPSFAKYNLVDEVKADEIDFLSIGRNILASCKNIEEVKDYVNKIQGKIVAQANMPGHYFFIDKDGATLVLEPDEAGYLTVYDKTNGIMTNSPNYSYHLLNLHQYVNVQQVDGGHDSPIKGVDGQNIFAHGTSGAFGIPGDTSPASRFIKASYLRDTTTRKDLNTADDGVLRMFRILNNFDIVPGMSLKKIGAGTGEGGINKYTNPIDLENTSAGHTDHTDVKDLANGRFYYSTNKNVAPRYVDFSDYDLDQENYVTISMEKDDTIKYQKVTMK